jgi:hypothetical protein
MRKRELRLSPGGTRITARDVSILAFVERAQPVTTAQAALFASMSLPTARRRLKVLRDHGFLAAHVLRLEDPNILTLTARGRAHLARATDVEEDSLKSMRGIGRAQLRHHGIGVTLYALLSTASRRPSGARLTTYAFEDELRARVGAAKGAQVPDGVAIVELGGGGRVAVAVEADAGSENPSWVGANKVVPYTELSRRRAPLLGERDWFVAFVTVDRRRRNRLARAALDAGADANLFFFADVNELKADTVFTRGWWAIDVDEEKAEARFVERSPFRRSVSTDDVDRRQAGAPDNRNDHATMSAVGTRE